MYGSADFQGRIKNGPTNELCLVDTEAETRIHKLVTSVRRQRKPSGNPSVKLMLCYYNQVIGRTISKDKEIQSLTWTSPNGRVKTR